jgi:hypothetical protein
MVFTRVMMGGMLDQRMGIRSSDLFLCDSRSLAALGTTKAVSSQHMEDLMSFRIHLLPALVPTLAQSKHPIRFDVPKIASRRLHSLRMLCADILSLDLTHP